MITDLIKTMFPLTFFSSVDQKILIKTKLEIVNYILNLHLKKKNKRLIIKDFNTLIK